jgi:hypothetical protein
MKVLTVKNPWADWIINGYKGTIKDAENRRWEALYRGRLYIHVSKTIDKLPLTIFSYGYSYSAADLERWKNQRGCIIGSVELYGIDRNMKSSWDEEGLFHWRFRDPRPLKELIPARGALGLWEYTGELGE